MGIVINQSFKNTLSTYIGFGIGAINTLFLYTNFLTDEYYGLVAFILSTANIMMPFMAFGVHNAIVKYYSSYKSKQSINSFLTLMLFLPLVIIIPLGFIGYVSLETIANILGTENTIVKDYVWHIFIIATAMAYFEIFYSWTKVHLKTVFGNVMKEIFHRVLIMILLFSVYLRWISADEFIMALVVVYVLRMALMKLYAYSIKFPSLAFKKPNNFKDIITYAALMIVAGSIAMIILDIDKFMIGLMLEHIENVAYYSVAIFIATVIAVPQRAMHQIMMPLTAQYLNNKNLDALKDLYQRSSLNLVVVSGLIFLLIVLNINQLYLILPKEFTGGLIVVIVVSIAKLFDNALGNNNAILFNSNYYRMVLFFGIMLTVLAVVLNLIFIPNYGINGSAIATFLSITIYNTIKVLYVKRKFKMQPFTFQTIKVMLLIFLFSVMFFFWDFPFHPLIGIALKSFIVVTLYILVIYKWNVSEDISKQINAFLDTSNY